MSIIYEIGGWKIQYQQFKIFSSGKTTHIITGIKKPPFTVV